MKSVDKIRRMAYLILKDPELRWNRELSQKEIANMFHVEPSTMSVWLSTVEKEMGASRNRSQEVELQKELRYLKELILQLEEKRILWLPTPKNTPKHK